ncbi:MAG TPA: exonuclease domain-containing protein [Rhodocyclaceae bacterium]
MNARTRFLLAIFVLGLLMTGPFMLTVGILLTDLSATERAQLIHVLQPRLPIGIFMTAFGFVLGVQVLRQLFRQYVRGLRQMAEHLQLMLGANRNFRVVPEGPPEVVALARAANELAIQRDALLEDVEQRITEAKNSVEADRNRLAALMSQLALGVIVCNLDGRILLYNSRARLLFTALAKGPTAMNQGTLIGLGRSIYSILDKAQVAHALESIQSRLDRGASEPMANFVTTSRSGQLLRAQTAPVLSGEEGQPPRITGYVLTVEDITRSLEQELARDQVLHTLADGNRGALGNVRAAAETLLAHPDMESEMRGRLLQVVADETGAMSQRLDQTTSEFSDALKTRWPLEDVLGSDVISAARKRIADKLGLATSVDGIDDQLWVRADTFSLVQAITSLAGRLQEHHPLHELRFRLSADNRLAFVDLAWHGFQVTPEALYNWEMEPMRVASEVLPLSLRDVLERHGGEIWNQRETTTQPALFRLAIPLATPPGAAIGGPQPTQSRPEYYDFDLFSFSDTSIDLDRPLAELAYSVFDTETTGLEPSAGDEIIQIGAVRIVNNRLLRQELFDQLVDPRRSLSPEGIAIHGISEDMLRDQPTIDAVLPAFHEFCAETVLVAHNAAFDMRFLQLKEASTGIAFSQPVLDTLLLSAVVHPGQDSHKLEAIAERLGIAINQRHNALGDALVTAEVFLRLLPLLREAGITTLRQALDAAEKTYFARIKY